MALSNMLKEPRREITESVIGIGVVGAFLTGDYYFARWFHEVTGGDGGAPLLVGMVAGASLVVMAYWFAVGTHALGESICNALERQGVNLRPRRPAPESRLAPMMVDPQESLERQAQMYRAYTEQQAQISHQGMI